MTLTSLRKTTPITFEVNGETLTKNAAMLKTLLVKGKLTTATVNNPRVIFGGGRVGQVDITK